MQRERRGRSDRVHGATHGLEGLGEVVGGLDGEADAHPAREVRTAGGARREHHAFVDAALQEGLAGRVLVREIGRGVEEEKGASFGRREAEHARGLETREGVVAAALLEEGVAVTEAGERGELHGPRRAIGEEGLHAADRAHDARGAVDVADARARHAVALGEGMAGKIVPVALAGRVPAIVTTQNGNISIGNHISTSSIVGVGAKQIKAGSTIGTALENTTNWSNATCQSISSLDQINWPVDDGTNPNKPCFRLPDGTYVGKIMVFVNVSWYDPDVYLTSTGDLNIQINPNSASTTDTYQLTNKETIVDKIGAFASATIAKIEAGLIETKKLVVDGVDILKKLNELSDKSDKQEKTIEAQQKQIDELKRTIDD